MSDLSNENYVGGISFGTPNLGDMSGTGGFHFDLPLATIAAFNSQALDFASGSQSNRFGFFQNVQQQATNEVAQSSQRAFGVIGTSLGFLQSISDTFKSIFNGGTSLGGLPAAPVIATPIQAPVSATIAQPSYSPTYTPQIPAAAQNVIGQSPYAGTTFAGNPVYGPSTDPSAQVYSLGPFSTSAVDAQGNVVAIQYEQS